MKVCEKVKKKGTTSYNEVADELVGEFTNPAHVNSLTDQVSLFLYCVHNIAVSMKLIWIGWNEILTSKIMNNILK